MMFENDIFISYSHKDDRPLPGEKAGWVSELEEALEVRVGELLGGKPPKIWRDPQQSGNEYFVDTFFDQLRKTAALVSVLSPNYFSSGWCPRELDAFFEACQGSGGLRINNYARVFKVVKTPIPEPEQERIPPQLSGFLGYDFYTVGSRKGYVQEYRRAYGEEIKFFKKADDLAQDISKLLRELRGLEPKPHPEVSNRRGFVYLAVTSSDLKEAREDLFRDLDHSGYTVLPDGPLPATSPEVETLVREQVARCQLAIHMIGSKYGVVPEGTTLSIPVLQNELSAERSRGSDLARLVWLSPTQPIEDQRQKDFIESFQTSKELQDGMDPLTGSLEDLKLAVHRRLERPASQPGGAKKEPGGETTLRRVYLIHDREDRGEETIVRLMDLLLESGCEPTTPLFEEIDEADIRQDHEENLRTCEGVLLYWGAGSEAWRRKKQKEVVYRSAGLGRSGAPPILLYIAPPVSLEKEVLRTREVMVVRHPPEGPSAALLADFLAQIRRGGPKVSDEPV